MKGALSVAASRQSAAVIKVSHRRFSKCRYALAALAFLSCALCLPAFAPFSIPWHTMDGGGGTSTVGAFTLLAPRQPLTVTPYATTASYLAGSVNAAHIPGPLALDQLPPEVVANFASGVKLEGSFLGDGGGLTGLDAAQLAAPFRWRSCPPPRRPCIFNNQQLKK